MRMHENVFFSFATSASATIARYVIGVCASGQVRMLGVFMVGVLKALSSSIAIPADLTTMILAKCACDQLVLESVSLSLIECVCVCVS